MTWPLQPWHGCMEHNHNHCPECRSCDCWEAPQERPCDQCGADPGEPCRDWCTARPDSEDHSAPPA